MSAAGSSSNAGTLSRSSWLGPERFSSFSVSRMPKLWVVSSRERRVRRNAGELGVAHGKRLLLLGGGGVVAAVDAVEGGVDELLAGRRDDRSKIALVVFLLLLAVESPHSWGVDCRGCSRCCCCCCWLHSVIEGAGAGLVASASASERDGLVEDKHRWREGAMEYDSGDDIAVVLLETHRPARRTACIGRSSIFQSVAMASQ